MSMPSNTVSSIRPPWSSGWLNGLIGVVIFSASLPATRVAVLDLDPLFLTFARATIAGMLGVALLRLGREAGSVRQRGVISGVVPGHRIRRRRV